MYRYTVEDQHPYTINIFNTDVNNDIAFIYQPHAPSGRDWESPAEAEAWAQEWITSMENAEVNPPSEEEIMIETLASLGITVDKLKAVLGLS